MVVEQPGEDPTDLINILYMNNKECSKPPTSFYMAEVIGETTGTHRPHKKDSMPSSFSWDAPPRSDLGMHIKSHSGRKHHLMYPSNSTSIHKHMYIYICVYIYIFYLIMYIYNIYIYGMSMNLHS